MPALTLKVQNDRYCYLQRRVPTVIMTAMDAEARKAALGTASAIVKVYLGDDQKEAKRRASAEWGRLQDLFDQLSGKAPQASMIQASTDALEAMAWSKFTTLRAYLEQRINAAGEFDRDELKRGYTGYCQPWEMGLTNDVWETEATAETRKELADRRLSVQEGSQRFFQARRLIAQAIVQAHDAAFSRLEGDYTFKPTLPQREARQAASVDASSGVPLSGLFDAWKQDRNPPAKTVVEFDKSIRRFIELHGDASPLHHPMPRFASRGGSSERRLKMATPRNKLVQ